MQQRSISTKNLKASSGTAFKLSTLSSNHNREIKTYKLDGMKLLAHKINAKIKEYLDLIMQYADNVKHNSKVDGMY